MKVNYLAIEKRNRDVLENCKTQVTPAHSFICCYGINFVPHRHYSIHIPGGSVISYRIDNWIASVRLNIDIIRKLFDKFYKAEKDYER